MLIFLGKFNPTVFSNKRVESEVFAIFPVEATKTSIATNCDHSKNYVQLIQTLQDWPNISANDPDLGSGSKNLSLNWDHF